MKEAEGAQRKASGKGRTRSRCVVLGSGPRASLSVILLRLAAAWEVVKAETVFFEDTGKKFGEESRVAQGHMASE